jgi:hypothetical protein
VIFSILRSLIEETLEEQKWSESDMASGSDFRSDNSHESNISLSSPTEYDKEREGKIKRERRASSGKRRKVLVEKM